MYQIGQFRRSQMNSNFYTGLNFDDGYKITSAQDFDIHFKDYHAYNINFNSENYYYIRFNIKQNEVLPQKFQLILRNTEKMEDNEQIVENQLIVDRGTLTNYFDLIIAPNSNYNEFSIEMKRTLEDYQIVNQNQQQEVAISGRIPIIDIEIIGQITNIIDVLKNSGNYSNLKKLSKIGIQGPPSLLMCINGEQIRIGKSGIYELNNGINISFIGFIPRDSINPQEPIDYFIMDFEY